MIRRITIDFEANVYEVTNLFDALGIETLDLNAATACVVRLAHNQWVNEPIPNVPIYTVH